MIDVRNLHKTYGALEVLKGIDLQVARGEIIAIIGPSGSGKSTLLRSLNQLETVNAGEIFLDGVQVNQPGTGRAAERHLNTVHQQMGMVFQHFNLFPHLTVLDNITLGPIKLRGKTRAEAQALALSLLEKVGLADKAAMGRRTFTRMFKQQTGLSFEVWKREMRLMEAISLLNAGLSVTQAALDVGYENVSAFTARFRQTMGVPPTVFLKQGQPGDDAET